MQGCPPWTSLLNRVRAALAAWLVFGAVAFASSALAEGSARQLVVLQSDRGLSESPFTREVDERVLAAVAQRAGFSRAYISPVPFEDVELAAGCSGHDAGCLQRIAATLDADWIMVRELARDTNGRMYLTLVAHDGPLAIVTRRAVAELSKSGPRAPVNVVPLLVERLYPGASGAAESALRTSPAPRVPPLREPVAQRSTSPARIVGWSALGTGSALLVAGAVVGVLSRRDQNEHARLDIDGTASADRAHELFERAERRTDIANGLLFSGAGLGAAGVAALLWDYLRPKQDKRLSLRVVPGRSGAAISLRTSFRGGL